MIQVTNRGAIHSYYKLIRCRRIRISRMDTINFYTGLLSELVLYYLEQASEKRKVIANFDGED